MIASGTCGGVRADKVSHANAQQGEEIVNGGGPGYRDLTDKDIIQAGDIYYNPEWEVGGPWYLVREGSDAIGTQYVPGRMKLARRPISK